MIIVVVILAAMLCLGWILLIRHFRALQLARIHLVRREQREVFLQQELEDVKEKYRKLEDKFRKLQYELYAARHRDDTN
ncbi:hypothetical protein [Chitinophaga sp. 212800010-3]|uniref:hypothetical protein n=1 Tax=unclassified Chitinophaga TaxID=2619133 RepID=UPI002DF0FB55|nr:hypothetical protein [Chitinophaga sp. 212800010-3]